jgi:hypothetical protein
LTFLAVKQKSNTGKGDFLNLALSEFLTVYLRVESL